MVEVSGRWVQRRVPVRDGRWERALPVSETLRDVGAGVQSAGYRLAGLARLAERRVGLVQSRLGLLAFGWLSEAPRGHG